MRIQIRKAHPLTANSKYKKPHPDAKLYKAKVEFSPWFDVWAFDKPSAEELEKRLRGLVNLYNKTSEPRFIELMDDKEAAKVDWEIAKSIAEYF